MKAVTIVSPESNPGRRGRPWGQKMGWSASQQSRRSKPSTRRLRYALLRSFLNFISTSLDPASRNPCDSLALRKAFRAPKPVPWKIIDKEVADEIIFRTRNPRNRLILELIARGGMRIGEVLGLTPGDVSERKITIRSPKSGKEAEVAFIPQKVADRLKDYIRAKGIQSKDDFPSHLRRRQADCEESRNDGWNPLNAP